MSDAWRRCQGPGPRLVRWLCHHGPARWQARAREYALDRVGEELENARTQALLSAVWTTGQSMLGTVDDEGNFRIQVLAPESEPEDE